MRNKERKKELLKQVTNKHLLFILSVSKKSDKKITKLIKEILMSRVETEQDIRNDFQSVETAVRLNYRVGLHTEKYKHKIYIEEVEDAY